MAFVPDAPTTTTTGDSTTALVPTRFIPDAVQPPTTTGTTNLPQPKATDDLYNKFDRRAQTIADAWAGPNTELARPLIRTGAQVAGGGVDFLMQILKDAGGLAGKIPGVKAAGAGAGNLAKKVVGGLAKVPAIKEGVGIVTDQIGKGVESIAPGLGYDKPDELKADLMDILSVLPVGGAETKGAAYLADVAKRTATKTAPEVLTAAAKATTQPKTLLDLVKGAVTKPRSAGDIAAHVLAGKGATPAMEAENAAAARSGIPLTRSQTLTPLGGNVAPAALGAVEKVAQTLPGGVGVMTAQKRQASDAVKTALESISGGKLGQIAPEDLAAKIQVGLQGTVQKLDTGFRDMYGTIVKAGNKLEIDGYAVGQEAKKRINAKFPIFDESGFVVGKEMPTGVTSSIAQSIGDIVAQVSNIGIAKTPDKYSLLRTIKTQVGDLAFGPDAYKLGHNDREAYKALYGTLVDAEVAHIAKIAGEDGVKQLKDVNRFFAATKDIRDVTAKLSGYNKGVDEAGFVDVTKPLDNLLKPSNMSKTSVVMKLMDEDTRQNLRTGLMARLIDRSILNSSGDISVNKLANNIKQYNGRALRMILGDDKANQLVDVVRGLRRARADKFNLITDTNPSGTGAAVWSLLIPAGEAIAGGVGGHAAGQGLISALPAAVGAAASGAYGVNLMARFLVKRGFNPLEKTVAGGVAGAGAGFALSGDTPEEQTAGLITGALAGMGFGSGMLQKAGGMALKSVPEYGGSIKDKFKQGFGSTSAEASALPAIISELSKASK